MAGQTRVGLIGCGPMGMVLGRALVQIPNARISCVHDLSSKAAEAAAGEFTAAIADSPEKLLSTDSVDAVIIAAPPSVHESLARQAAAAGVHVFSEKPLSLSSASCRRIIKECKSNKVVLMVGQVLRYFPVPARVIEVLQSGRAGKPFAMHITRMGHGWGREGGWRLRNESSGGVLPEVNIHEIDLMRVILGEVETVSASGGNWRTPYVDFEDTIQLLFRFESGASGTLTTSLASEIGIYTATLLCTNGTFNSDNFWSHVTFKQAKAKEAVYDASNYRGLPPFVRELKEFIASVRKDAPVTIPGEDALQTIKIIEAAKKSMETGKEVRVRKG